MHAIGHVAANLSFAAVAISLTHTVKTLEPAFNVLLSQVGVWVVWGIWVWGVCGWGLSSRDWVAAGNGVAGKGACLLIGPRSSVLVPSDPPPPHSHIHPPTPPTPLRPQVILGQATPLPAIVSLVPIMLGVAMASAAELSFNWMGFLTAMASNLTFGFRAVWSKRAMTTIKNLGSTGIYAYTTLISCFICIPGVLIMEPGVWGAIKQQVAAKGAAQFYGALLSVGLLYHLYNQFAFNTLARVSPVSHGVCNVVKRVAIIATSGACAVCVCGGGGAGLRGRYGGVGV